jgi:hypothetical protein
MDDKNGKLEVGRFQVISDKRQSGGDPIPAHRENGYRRSVPPRIVPKPAMFYPLK